MTQRTPRSFWTEDRAAISPLFAVGILALVAVAGVGFDYGRLMALDSELQNAADQAALAAVTQLDGGEDSMIRARDAANNTFATAASAYVNETRFANDKRITGATNTRPIVNLTFRFYDDYLDDRMGTEITDDDNGDQAKVVEVTVNARQVFYALTPVVAAISSGPVIGRALAGLETGTCDVPPMMFCVPHLTGTSNPDTGFPQEEDFGKGLELHMNANAADPWAPGNFGFLDIDYDTKGSPNHRLGQNSSGAGCNGEVIESQTGVRDPESTALNTRFDIYPNGGNIACDIASGDFCPAANTRKSFTFNEVSAIRVRSTAPVPAAPQCGTYDSRTGWDVNPAANGMPEDNCFVSEQCEVLGTEAASAADPNWAADAYMTAHHTTTLPEVTTLDPAPDGTRYEVYLWELENRSRLAAKWLSSSYTTRTQGANTTYTFTNICAYGRPTVGTGLEKSDTQKDRRVLTVAAVDCTGLNGSAPVRILRWVDLFLVKPADETGQNKAFFTEIIGPAKKPNGDSGFQFYSRKKAVLIR